MGVAHSLQESPGRRPGFTLQLRMAFVGRQGGRPRPGFRQRTKDLVAVPATAAPAGSIRTYRHRRSSLDLYAGRTLYGLEWRMAQAGFTWRSPEKPGRTTA